ncbi:MAG: hypothetical protein AAGJ79_01935 [Verrucomicrobiota bacterium]
MRPPFLRPRRLAILFLATSFVIFAMDEGKAEESQANDTLGKELETIYLAWKDSIETGNVEKWVANSTRFSRRSIRNAIVSRKMDFPEAFFENPIRPPSLIGLKFIHALAVGETAQAVYFGRADFQLSDSSADVPNSLLVLRFLKETDGWKFDSTQLLSLAGMTDLEAKIRAGDYAFLDDDLFIPPGQGPEIPELCPIPEVAGHFDLVSIGYETTVYVNDFAQPSIANNGGSHILLGGLKRGFNKIVIRSKEVPPPVAEDGTRPESLLEFNIYAIRDSGGTQKSERLFRYAPDKVTGNFMMQIRGDGG